MIRLGHRTFLMRWARMGGLLPGLLLLACDWMPGKPDPAHQHVRPEAVVDYESLYRANCAGCHGRDGQAGPATPLGDPLYQAWAPADAILDHIRLGVPNTAMPAFAEQAGGNLTERQITVLVEGLKSRHARTGTGRDLPAYRATGDGDTRRGAEVFATFCAECHGTGGKGAKFGSVVEDSYLALVSKQGLRTTVVVGRPDLGMPSYQGYAQRAMNPDEIQDVVAWLWAQRVEFPGRVPVKAEGHASGSLRGSLEGEP